MPFLCEPPGGDSSGSNDVERRLGVGAASYTEECWDRVVVTAVKASAGLAQNRLTVCLYQLSDYVAARRRLAR